MKTIIVFVQRSIKECLMVKTAKIVIEYYDNLKS